MANDNNNIPNRIQSHVTSFEVREISSVFSLGILIAFKFFFSIV